MNVEHLFLNKEHPKTVDEAVRHLLSILSEQDKEKIKMTPRERLPHLQLGGIPLGTIPLGGKLDSTPLISIFGLRKFFELLKTSPSLINSCKIYIGIHPLLSIQPDEVPDIIVEALWESLQGFQKLPISYLKSS